MPTVADLLAVKGNVLHTIAPDASVLDATRKMNREGIGALIVMSGKDVVGIFTERDVLKRIVVEQRSALSVTVADVMSSDVICVPPDADIEDVGAVMREKRVRHLPVCGEDGQLHGLISIGDLNAFHSSNQEQTIHSLQDYIYGRV